MMRILLAAALVAVVAGQEAPRLGLLGPELGLNPVPGVNPGGSSSVPTGCFCIPIQQRCIFDNEPFLPLDTNVRINVNLNAGPCGSPEMKTCCPNGLSEPDLPPTFGSCGNAASLPRPQGGLANFGEFPWMAMLLTANRQYIGGGALIAPDWVLTAAHKVPTNFRSLIVRLGELDFNTQDPRRPAVDLAVDRVVVHPSFNPRALTNNVALLHLARPVDTSRDHIGTVCLPNSGQTFNGARCFVSGWGGDVSLGLQTVFNNQLRGVSLPLVGPFACGNRLRAARPSLGEDFSLDAVNFLCAGGEEGNDACSGDGGSPLVCRRAEDPGWTVVGLVSWGVGCGQRDVPGVYTNVASFVNFIRQHVRV